MLPSFLLKIYTYFTHNFLKFSYFPAIRMVIAHILKVERGRKMKKLCVFCLFLFYVPILSGCQETPKESRLVTLAQISCQRRNGSVHRVYTDPRKISAVLYYLRIQTDCGKARLNPEMLQCAKYEITLQYADGHTRVFYQQGDEYLLERDKTWHKIDPDQGSLLYPLLLAIPADPENISVDR